MTAAVVGVAVLVALAVTAWRESQAELARQRRRMYDGRRHVVDIIVAARIDYFAHVAPADEIRDRTRQLESFDLDRAAQRIVAEMGAAGGTETS